MSNRAALPWALGLAGAILVSAVAVDSILNGLNLSLIVGLSLAYLILMLPTVVLYRWRDSQVQTLGNSSATKQARPRESRPLRVLSSVRGVAILAVLNSTAVSTIIALATAELWIAGAGVAMGLVAATSLFCVWTFAGETMRRSGFRW